MAALNDAYKVEPADGMSRNTLLHSQNIETFFVTSRNTNEASVHLEVI